MNASRHCLIVGFIFTFVFGMIYAPSTSISTASNSYAAEMETDEKRVADDASTQVDRIREIFKIQQGAWNRGDLEAFMEYYWKSKDLTFSAGGKTTRGWQETLDRYKKGYPSKEKMGKLTFSKFEISLLSDTVAMALGNWHLKRSDGDREGNFSVIFKKMDKKWVIVHDHSSSLEKEEDASKD